MTGASRVTALQKRGARELLTPACAVHATATLLPISYRGKDGRSLLSWVFFEHLLAARNKGETPTEGRLIVGAPQKQTAEPVGNQSLEIRRARHVYTGSGRVHSV